MNAETVDALTIELVRVYDAPRDLVFRMWTDPEHLNRWCHPKDFTVTASGGDIRPGGAWHSTITAPDGTDYRMAGTYREIVANERLVFTHAWIDADGSAGVERVITVLLEDAEGGGTRLTFHEAPFDAADVRDSNSEGWAEVLDSLDAYLPTVG
ncbi:MAG: SRPBCC domain-containing protein [Alphaproteobacteria bacterium]|nr:SRPBCC domain-containing protein [Alphaproteobacteria bacterium]